MPSTMEVAQVASACLLVGSLTSAEGRVRGASTPVQSQQEPPHFLLCLCSLISPLPPKISGVLRLSTRQRKDLRSSEVSPTPCPGQLLGNPLSSGSLARGRLILLSKLYKILILQSGNLGGKNPQQWENVGYAAQTFSSQGINYKNTHSAISIQMNT